MNVEHYGHYLSRNMTENNRKRPRDDDNCEFMPLSKRIKSLHINNINNNLVSPSAPVQETSQLNGIQLNGINAENGISTSNSSSDSERRPSYDPGVGSSESNYYFDNKLLFELHLERIQRTGQQFPY